MSTLSLTFVENIHRMQYDSEIDTLRHIKRVNQLLLEGCAELLKRAAVHDDSKLLSPEKERFDEETPKLVGLTYGTPEYSESIARLGPALEHHYANNSHHPQFYPNGINGMDLFDVMEMFFDWCAASERHADGNIERSLDVSKSRFGISDQLDSIFRNTAMRYYKKA